MVLILALLVMSSCTLLNQYLNQEDEVCQHEYTTVETAPTCTAKGYSTYTCKHCQKTFVSDETEMIAHNFVDGACTACGAGDPDFVPHTHTFVDGVCECGETDPDYVPPHEHNFVDGVCECGELAPHEHNFVEGKCECGEYDHEHECEENIFYHPALVAATCCEPGVAVFECIYCDYYYTEESPIDPEAHAFWGELQVVAEANCQTKTDGHGMVSCANGCGELEEVIIYYSEVHDWDVQKETYATCTTDGEYYAICTLCGEEESYVSYAEGHYNWYLTCGDSGTCMACGEEFTLEHNTALNPATCTTPAFCMNCWSDVGEPLGHSFDGAHCSVCGEMDTEHYEEVDYNLNISDLETGTLASDSINGVFTIVSGSEIRNRNKTFEGVDYSKSVKIGNSTTKIKILVPGAGRLSFLVQNGSSGADMQFITVTAPDGTVYDFEFVGNAEGSPVVKIELDVTEGEWVISRGKNGGTQDIFALSLSCVVEKSDESGFALVADGKVNYLVGDTLDFSGVRLNATFSNGKTEPLALENVTVDSSAVNTAESGTYPVVLTYKDYEPITIYVNIYAPESIELGFDAIEKISNNSYGNGVYYNHSFRELYFVGEELDLSGLTVTVVAKCGDETLKFIVDDYTISDIVLDYADFFTLTVFANGISTEINISVTDVVPTPNEEGVYQLLVDPAYQGLPGYISGPYHTFKTIQEALDFAAKIDAGKVKELNIAPGYYNEKLEITVPNLHIIGWGETPDEVVIEWNSIYGIPDASGFSHVTDSTATVAVRESAYNVTIENVTISNYWNSQERMDLAGLEIERALALLVQADRFTMKNSKLLGIQDTLELFTGRQYFENVYISGYTDFIFGTNNTTLFKGCTIHVIDTAKDDKGTAGYITAFKGSNKGAGDAIVYGAIFDGCKFTADAGVMNGCTAIGRTWGAYAAVAVINSELGGHISLAGYSTNKNERYVSMNGKPTDSTVQFVEFNNTGAGALTEAVAGMRFLTADEAALYTNMAVIFGTANGNVTYLDPWNPESSEIIEDDRTYYYFNGVEGTSGTSYTYMENIQGTVTEWNGLTVDTTTGKLTYRESDSQFNQGAKIILTVEAGTTVTIISYPGYGYYTINGVAHNANDTFSVYFAEATEVVIEATATSYIYQIIVNPNEEAPAAPTLNEIKVSGVNANYNVGDEFSLESAVVKAYYSDFSVVTLTDYTVDASAVNTAAAGSYDVVFTYGGKSVTVTVTFVGVDTPIDLNVTFGSEGNYKDSGIDFSNIEIGDNGGNNSQIKNGYFSFNVKAGATVTINGYPGYTSYTLSDGTVTTEEITAELYTYIATADVTITITPVSGNNYFYALSVVYPVEEEAVDFTVTFGSEGNYLDSGIDFSGLQVVDNGGNNSQVKNGSFSFNVKAGAVITINGYPGYTSYTLGDGTMTTEEITAELYTYTATADVTITITPVSGNNYFYSFSVVYPKEAVKEDFEVTFGSEGNYLDSGIDFSNIEIGDNGGSNSQVKNGSFSFDVFAGAVVTINGYPSYTSYTLGDGTMTTEEITAELYTYTATADVTITITPVSGNNYFYSFSVTYPAGGDVEEPTPDEPTEEPTEPVTYVFDATLNHEAMAEGAKADGDTATFADGFFTIHYSAKTKVDGSSKNFSDGYSASQRVNMGGKTAVGSTTKNAIEFTTEGPATITIWWVCGGDAREIDIYDADGNIVYTTAESCVKNGLYITTIELAEGGTYYVGSSAGSNYYFKVEVTVG